MDALGLLWVACTSASYTKGQDEKQVGIPFVLVSVTPRALVTTPAVEYNFLASVEHDMTLKGRNEP